MKGVAIAVDLEGDRFCVSRDEATKDWLLHYQIGPSMFDFETVAHRFPFLPNVQNVSSENQSKDCCGKVG